ncbi:hypothetical protein NE237_010221 [Protea cynaroides]|uniref:Uncharacterized protein n=1 Tax=Protea cynaroides TaxID=273540 RepID=A0A9Q0KZU1_9MAGN|nr:hypothetical protein NE237_010221 [Protea cynaroides]
MPILTLPSPKSFTAAQLAAEPAVKSINDVTRSGRIYQPAHLKVVFSSHTFYLASADAPVKLFWSLVSRPLLPSLLTPLREMLLVPLGGSTTACSGSAPSTRSRAKGNPRL